MKRLVISGAALVLALSGSVVRAQDTPAEYKQVLTTLGKQGDFNDKVLKVNIPRNDLSVTVKNVKTPTPFGFGGWIAMTKGSGDMDVMMGDLVLLQEEVNPIALAGPLFIGGTLKIAYDVHLHGSFRRLRPPEERPLSTVAP